MDELKDIIKERRKELKLTLLDVAKACDVSEGTVSRWESGEIGDMKRSRISALAKILRLSPSIIVGTIGDDDAHQYDSAGLDYIKVPLYDNLCCGNGGFVEDNIIDYIPVPSAGLNLSKEYFCQYAQGDSMKDAGIIDHDLLVFEKTPIVNNGDIGCFCIDENVATCKKYRETGGIIALVPMNSNYDPIVIDVTSSSFRCLGKLKKSIREY